MVLESGNRFLEKGFGHLERKTIDFVIRMVDSMERSQTIREKGRPGKTGREIIKKDLKINDLDKIIILDKTLWKKLIYEGDPT